MPRAARSAARRSATASPYGDAAREPTMATAGRSSAAAAPRVHSTKGGSAMAASAAGYERVAPGQRRDAADRPRDGSPRPRGRRASQAFGCPPLRRATSSASTVRGVSPARRRSAARRQVHGGSSDNADRDDEIGERPGQEMEVMAHRARTCGARPPVLNYTQEGTTDRIS